MNFQEEIEYRKLLLAKISGGAKVSSEDRLWLQTHCTYNKILGYPHLNADIIHVQPNEKYCLNIKLELNAQNDKIIPVISIPANKGNIVTNTTLTNLDGKVVPCKPIKVLGVMINSTHTESQLNFCSTLGLLKVSYECTYYDDMQNIFIQQSSSTGDPSFAMLKEVLSENKVLYRCKHPKSDKFDKYSFSVEWKLLANKGKI